MILKFTAKKLHNFVIKIERFSAHLSFVRNEKISVKLENNNIQC